MAQQNLSSRGRQNDKKAAPKQLNRTSKTSDTPRKYVKRGDDDSKSFSGPKKNYKSSGNSSPGKRYEDREGDSKSFSKDRRSNSDQSDRPKRTFRDDNSAPRRTFRDDNSAPKRTFRDDNSGPRTVKKVIRRGEDSEKKVVSKRRISDSSEARENTKPQRPRMPKKTAPVSDTIRLNKYISNAGVCSRREADMYIKAGNVTVNGKIVTEMGYQVKPLDEVRFDDTAINPEAKRYVLLNKPKDYITTLDDEKGRKTVMELVSNACKERIYPVGRLDRNTTGLLLFTNDGDLAKKLTHPKHNIHKLYHVTLDKNLTAADMNKIADPSFLIEDIPVFVDHISYVDGSPKTEVGVEIHSGRNRIVRKVFESLGYSVSKLDRVIFAGLTKKDLPKGRWRHLSEQEVINLRMIK
ncbi:MAG: pseudouridine synthase [Flavobacteriaceae bacterium]|nr:pseudouridine synthase [Flavobacteriaceae bacterium]